MTTLETAASVLPATMGALCRQVNAGEHLRHRDDVAAAEAGILATALALVPDTSWASIDVWSPGQKLPTIMAGNEQARSFDQLQFEVAEGPSLDALEPGELQVTCDDLHAAFRWPVLANRMRRSESAVRAVVSCAMSTPSGHRAVLNLYREPDRARLAPAGDVVATAAAVASMGLAVLLHRRLADNLTLALDSNRLIGAALGVLMCRYGWTYTQAFDHLRTVSQHGHVKLRELADEVITVGELPATALRVLGAASQART